jgi:hypothetical protein
MLPKYEAYLEEKIQKFFLARVIEVQPGDWPPFKQPK